MRAAQDRKMEEEKNSIAGLIINSQGKLYPELIIQIKLNDFIPIEIIITCKHKVCVDPGYDVKLHPAVLQYICCHQIYIYYVDLGH